MKEIPVILFGAGGVGRALLRQLVATRELAAARNGIRFQLRAVVDSSGWRRAAPALTDGDIRQLIEQKERRQPIGEKPPALAELLSVLSQPGLVVDVTAAAGMEPVLDGALAAGHGVVLANKKPLAGRWEQARHYFNNPLVRHESTVGGGQPVIATLRYLLDTGDPILQIAGQLSGTLGFICQQLDAGLLFSEALALAQAKGYTEPDPREDLGGRDVMRKILILGRMAGWPLSEAEIEVESLYPAALAQLPVAEFMQAAVALNPGMATRQQTAAARGQILRYVATVTAGKGAVSLQELPAGSPLANMKYISFQSGRYQDEPLIIGGKGAGVEMTAAGVLGDMLDLGREMPFFA